MSADTFSEMYWNVNFYFMCMFGRIAFKPKCKTVISDYRKINKWINYETNGWMNEYIKQL